MAVADTYNGDLVKIRQKAKAEKSADEVGLTAAQEEAYALINQEIDKAGGSSPVATNSILKLAEALMGAGLWVEANIFPAQGKEFSDTNFDGDVRNSLLYQKGWKYLQSWIDAEYGESSDDADEWAFHGKVERKMEAGARQDVEYKLIDGREGR